MHEAIAGPSYTLFLSAGIAKLLYRGMLVESPQAKLGCRFPPLSVETIRVLVRRRTMIGCSTAPFDLRPESAGCLDAPSRFALAQRLGRMVVAIATSEYGAGNDGFLTPPTRVRLIAAALELHHLICSSLPTESTLPAPVTLALPEKAWKWIDLERKRLRSLGLRSSGDHSAAGGGASAVRSHLPIASLLDMLGDDDQAGSGDTLIARALAAGSAL